MTQAARLESLERFRRGEVAYLLATDVAARGLDILGVHVRVFLCSCTPCCWLLCTTRFGILIRWLCLLPYR
jgi:hypothetical protein